VAIEMRPMRPEEMPAYWDALAVAFGASRPPRRPEEGPNPAEGEVRAEWTLCLFDDGQLATTYGAAPLQMYFNGRVAPIHGVIAVSTLPWYRRRGHLRSVTEYDFRRLHEQGGPPIAVLTASMVAIYQRFGYAVVSTELRYKLDPRQIEFANPAEIPGRFVRVERDQTDRLQACYEGFAAGRTGYLVRDDYVWEFLTFSHEQPPRICVAYEEAGEVCGFLVYFTTRDPRDLVQFGGSVNVHCSDFIWRTPTAYRALWHYLREIDLAKGIGVRAVPRDDPAPHLFLEPRMLHATQTDMLLARVVDVERAFPLRGYEGEGTLTFAVEDELCPWNAGRWQVEVGGGRAHVQRTDAAPDLTLPAAAIGPLLFGHYSASQAARMGRLSVHEADALGRWDALLRTAYPPSCANPF
jgi:predicted acetyltransferase